ncbi:MAG TPA: class II aldolase/adducin family protein [Candidatus Binatia bacterium]|nr:class II aldolase/adducin family protein [Candidatus Binatia bacterium]
MLHENPALRAAVDELVAANRILANENVVDAFGHVSVRHPSDPAQFLLSRSRSPELVTSDDIMLYDLEGRPLHDDGRPSYIERFIHAGIYTARPDVFGVVHSHAEDVIPFGITTEPLVPVFHGAASMGSRIATWDIRERFGDRTNLLVSNMDHGHDLAKRLGAEHVVLMRGHGFAAAGHSLYEAVKIALYLPRNAKILTLARAFRKDVVTLSEGEIDALSSIADDAAPSRRAWEYWCAKAGITTKGVNR